MEQHINFPMKQFPIKKYNPFYDSLPLFSIYTLYNSQLMYIGGIDIYIYIFKYEIEKD